MILLLVTSAMSSLGRPEHFAPLSDSPDYDLGAADRPQRVVIHHGISAWFRSCDCCAHGWEM